MYIYMYIYIHDLYTYTYICVNTCINLFQIMKSVSSHLPRFCWVCWCVGGHNNEC